ncbi:DUF2520 domain-containing protein [Pontibacter qinzhouensis]|uniref:DUF2520 domain-containing protein n=1 Tax=Pontibacter qinzhouensis TaxID=2603253 RepID=A0A5C8K213_9BACT|nr:Rossmann-like and DUF2520 domain-containing protein [Pontibacter qinzhouensis]TXK44650.1 DUF2520 domain-containing protein [Pontibacter qinzhouensis]
MQQNGKKIALIGAGNVAWHLGQALAAAGHTISYVYSRTATHREALAAKLPAASPLAHLNLQHTATDCAIIAVPDAALATVAQELQVPENALVVHTSGSQPLQVLEQKPSIRAGVFYPLQTFSKEKPVDFSSIPILIEAQQEQTRQELKALAESLSQSVHMVSSEARKQLHVAAVFACNFTNHLLGISREILQQANLPHELLQPLIQETIAKATAFHPFIVQTGPAVRGDHNVLEEHLRLLQQQTGYRQLYELLSASIAATASQPPQ